MYFDYFILYEFNKMNGINIYEQNRKCCMNFENKFILNIMRKKI